MVKLELPLRNTVWWGYSYSAGHLSSIFAMICSAQRIASAMAATVAGTRAPESCCDNFLAARMEAAISSTRLRPSSTVAV
jgi:hypothetical protein